MKEKIKNDLNLTFQKLGLDPNNLEIINLDTDYVILNHSSNIYILFDKNYNIFNVEDLGDISKDELPKKVLLIYNYYLNTPDGVTSLFKFPYPFQNYTLKDIIDIGTNINITDLCHNFPLITNEEDKSNYIRKIGLLSYLKFLNLEINNYFINTYKMKLLNLEVPNIYLYVMSLINKINSNPNYKDILSNIGENINNNRLSYLLYNISYLLKEENKNNNNDLDILANSLLEKDTNKSLKKMPKIS